MAYELDALHEEMLAALPDRYQKTVGFPAWDLTRAFALAVRSLSEDVDRARAATDVDNLTGDALTRWCAQRKGVVRKPAACAAGGVTVVTGAGSIRAGDLFESQGGVQFAALEAAEVAAGDTVAVRAVAPGAAGNVAAGTVTRMPVTLPGISAVVNASAMSGGYDEEDDDSLRQRYYAAVRTPDASGNRNAYRNWALEVPGVGGARVFPLASGDNTVEVCILDAGLQPAGAELLEAVQKHIDPGGRGGGEGMAPIGAYCTVTTAAAVSIHVRCTAVLAGGYGAEEVLANVRAGLLAYLRQVAFQSSYVSYAKLANAVNDAEGVLDYAALTVNGGTENVPVGERQVAVLGEVALA